MIVKCFYVFIKWENYKIIECGSFVLIIEDGCGICSIFLMV